MQNSNTLERTRQRFFVVVIVVIQAHVGVRERNVVGRHLQVSVFISSTIRILRQDAGPPIALSGDCLDAQPCSPNDPTCIPDTVSQTGPACLIINKSTATNPFQQKRWAGRKDSVVPFLQKLQRRHHPLRKVFAIFDHDEQYLSR